MPETVATGACLHNALFQLNEQKTLRSQMLRVAPRPSVIVSVWTVHSLITTERYCSTDGAILLSSVLLHNQKTKDPTLL